MKSKVKKLPSFEELNSLFEFNPITGDLFRKTNGKKVIGKERCGYLNTSIFGKGIYKAHRIAYKLFYHQFDESKFIDHINGDPADNRIENLRLVTHRENLKNQRLPKNNTSGHVGVIWYRKINKWGANIFNGKKLCYLGVYSEFKDAVLARKQAEKHFNFHINHGKAVNV